MAFFILFILSVQLLDGMKADREERGTVITKMTTAMTTATTISTDTIARATKATSTADKEKREGQ